MKLEIPLRIAETVLSELTHFGTDFTPEGHTTVILNNEIRLQREPFIGYLEVDAGELETYLVCRHYTPLLFSAAKPGVEFASYLAPIGQLLAQRPGFAGTIGRRWLTLHATGAFTPDGHGANWDATGCRLAWKHEDN